MTPENDALRAALRDIESRAATALATQPDDTAQAERHLNKALAGIELRAHTSRHGIA